MWTDNMDVVINTPGPGKSYSYLTWATCISLVLVVRSVSPQLVLRSVLWHSDVLQWPRLRLSPQCSLRGLWPAGCLASAAAPELPRVSRLQLRLQWRAGESEHRGHRHVSAGPAGPPVRGKVAGSPCLYPTLSLCRGTSWAAPCTRPSWRRTAPPVNTPPAPPSVLTHIVRMVSARLHWLT